MSPRNWRAVLSRRTQVEAPPHQHPKLAKRISELSHRVFVLESARRRTRLRVEALEEGLQEQRRLSLRVAELTDLVTELVAAAARGEDEFRRVLSRLDPASGPAPGQPHDA